MTIARREKIYIEKAASQKKGYNDFDKFVFLNFDLTHFRYILYVYIYRKKL